MLKRHYPQHPVKCFRTDNGTDAACLFCSDLSIHSRNRYNLLPNPNRNRSLIKPLNSNGCSRGEKEEEESDKLETFFCHLYEFHNPASTASAFVPAELLARYAIDFVPASVVSCDAVTVSPDVSDIPVSSPPVSYILLSLLRNK